jgi:hypothetical protein
MSRELASTAVLGISLFKWQILLLVPVAGNEKRNSDGSVT